jgi:RsiW-degrading membrane proteinase PrsW (M82 family)
VLPQSILFASIGGVIPAILWLYFWLREDKKRPEPRGLIISTFILGMIAVVLALLLEKSVLPYLTGTALILAWALIEEILKATAALIGGLRNRAYNEPIDGMIYLITAALGFAALENVLFLFGPINEGNFLLSVVTGNVRFIGATLLHTITSASIGIALALSFYKSRRTKIISSTIGIISAVTLHTLFNSFILSSNDASMFIVFSLVWMAVVLLIIVFERIKRLRKIN